MRPYSWLEAVCWTWFSHRMDTEHPIFMLRGRTLTSFSLSTAAMIGLYLVGGSCLIYMNEHGYS